MDWQLRMQSLWEVIANAPQPVSIKEICELTGLRRTPYLLATLDWLFARRCIARKFEVQANGYAATVYWAIAEPPAPTTPPA
jgi:hypothetical protein